MVRPPTNDTTFIGSEILASFMRQVTLIRFLIQPLGREEFSMELILMVSAQFQFINQKNILQLPRKEFFQISTFMSIQA
jgi:hypothetical protein